MYPTKKLWEVINIIRWVTYKPENVLENWWIACFRTKNIQQKLYESDIVYIEKNIVKNPEKFLKNWDILVSSANSLELLWKCCLIENLTYEATLWWFITCFRSTEDINYKYFYYFYNSEKIQKIVRWFSRKTTWIANLQLTEVQNLPIPLPPLPTQQKIVFKLDSLFEKLDQSITLTKQNLANIEELNKSILEKIFKECEEKHEKRKLDEVSTIITWNTPSTKFPEYYWWNILWAWPTDIWDNKIINFTSKTLSQKWLIDWKARLVKKWSVLLVSIWTIWKVWIAWQDLTTNQQINSFEVNEKISWDFLYYFFQFYQKILKTLASKTVVPIINKTQCSQVLIPLPPLPEQQKIVEYLDNIFAKNKILQEKYKQNLKNFEELKQSILKQAFENEDFIK